MKHRHSGLALFASALATTFTLFPHTNYQTAFPRKSASQRMDEAWSRTGKQMSSAVRRVTSKNGISR